MKGYCKLIVSIIAILAVAVPRITFSASSENYQVTEEVIGAGGGVMSSANYTVLSTYGQAIDGVEMEGENFNASSGFVASALPTLEAAIDVDPDTLNLRSEGKWITCFITLPEGYPIDVFNPREVALTKVDGETLASFIFSDPEAIPPEEDLLNEDEEDILMVKFRRSEVQAVVPVGDEVELIVTGNLLNGATFQGADNIRVIDPGERKGNLAETKTKSGKGGK